MPRPILPCLAALALLAVACTGDALAPELPDRGAPRALWVNVSAWPWGSIDVRLNGDTLVVVRRVDFQAQPSPATHRLVPSAADWVRFWEELDAAGVRGWLARCVNETLVDGGGFVLELAYGEGARISARGTNAYPQRNGRCRDGTSPEYEALLGTMTRLLGRPFPGS
jgi:hypothetical protein